MWLDQTDKKSNNYRRLSSYMTDTSNFLVAEAQLAVDLASVYANDLDTHWLPLIGKEEESWKDESDWGSYRASWKSIGDRGPRRDCLDCGKHYSCAENRSRGTHSTFAATRFISSFFFFSWFLKKKKHNFIRLENLFPHLSRVILDQLLVLLSMIDN